MCIGIAAALIGSAVVGGAMSAYSANEQQNSMTDAANRQMGFQADQTGTAYQRATKDMEAAGLNPMLAYKLGGAQSGGGALAQTTDPLGGAGSEVMRLPEKLANVKLASASAANQQAQADNSPAKTVADTRLTNATAVA